MQINSKATIILLGVLVLIMLFFTCSTSKRQGPSSFVEVLLSAPEKVEIDGRGLVLETYIYCDLMPMISPSNNDLIAGITILEVNSQQIPLSLDVDRLWLIKDKEIVWEADLSSGRSPAHPSRLEGIAREGPCCGPSNFVDVVVRLINTVTKQTYLLKAPNQPIGAVF